VLLAAIQFNCTIVMLFRFIPILRGINSGLLDNLLITIGLLTVVASTVNIIVTKNYKRLIAYASVNHAGMIAIGLGTGKNANYGVILYVLSNALVKAILFFAAGNIKAKFETKNMPDLQGLIKDMPYSGLFLMIGIFALLGFAPFGSFIGELMILSSTFEIGNWFIFVALCFLIVITFVATGRSVFPMIWGTPRLEIHQRGESIFTLIPNLFYLFLLLSMGVYIPQKANELLIRVADMLGGTVK
jgi:hydrogenase-4 component F